MVYNIIVKYDNNGLIHQEYGPAVIYSNNVKEWWYHGKCHREDGPAIINNHYKSWLKNGKLHRIDGPAVIFKNGNKRWYQFGKRHHTDGPAVIYPDGSKEFWVNDVRITEEQFKDKKALALLLISC